MVLPPHQEATAARRLQLLDALTEAIELWTEHWNDNPKPFIWTKTAEAILAKQHRARAAVTASANFATHH